jgi:hypothetical protein
MDNATHCDDDCFIDDARAQRIVDIWKNYGFSDATLLPVIGFPSKAQGVGTLTHTTGDGMLLSINGLVSKSALSNNALQSFECSDGKYINLYEIMISDYPGKDGRISTVQYYINCLIKSGLSVSASHYHWTGSFMMPGATLIAAIHHQTTGDITPEFFTEATAKCLRKTLDLIEKRRAEFEANC